MEIGVHLPQISWEHEPLSLDRLLAVATAAERLGLGTISANDHIVWGRPWLDGPMALAAVLAAAPGVRLMTSLALPVVRGPFALAKALGGIDLLSGGRLDAGLGPTSTPSPSPSPKPTLEATTMPTDTPIPALFTLTSLAFSDGAAIPRRYSCDGRDVSPPLAWSGAPAGTKALLLTVTDPDARGFVHWVAWNLAPDLGSLTEGASGALPGGALEGRNDFGRTGWGGPCPPSGTHRYVFTLTALSAPLGLPRGTELAAVQRQAAGATIGETRLGGTYRR